MKSRTQSRAKFGTKCGIRRGIALFLAIVLTIAYCRTPVCAAGISKLDPNLEYAVWRAKYLQNEPEEGGIGAYGTFHGLRQTVARELGSYLVEDEGLMYLSSAWSGCFNSEYRNQLANEQKYVYEMMLMDYLKYGSKTTLPEMESNEVKFTRELYDTIAEDLGDNTIDYLDIENMSVEEAERIFQNSQKIGDLSEALSEIADGVNAVKDLIEALAEYRALQEVKEERIRLLKMAKDESKSEDFNKAAGDIIDVLENTTLKYVQGKSLDYLWNEGCDLLWGALCKKNPAMKVIDYGVKGLDVCFDTSNRASNNVRLWFLYVIDYYMEGGMVQASRNFRNAQTAENAQNFIDCFRGYVEFQMYGNDFAKEFLSDELNNGVASDLVNWLRQDNVQTAKELMERCDSQNQGREMVLKWIDQSAEVYWKQQEAAADDAQNGGDGQNSANNQNSVNGQNGNQAGNVTRDIVLVLDSSGSMDGEPFEQTKEASEKFIDTVLQKNSRVSVVSYESYAYEACGLTDRKQELYDTIENLYLGNMTNMYAGLEEADRILEGSQAQKRIIVLMSDGLPNEGVCDGEDYESPLLRYAEEMKNKGYDIYTLGFFSQLGEASLYYAQQLMEGLASPGLHYEVQSADDLVFFFDDIAGQIGGKQYVYIRIACPVDVTVKSGEEMLCSKEEDEQTRTSFGVLTYETIWQDAGAALGVDPDAGQDAGQNAGQDAVQWTDPIGVGEEPYGNVGSPEIGNGVFEDKVKILRLDMEQDYDIEIEGYGDGKMDYTVSFPNENGVYDDVREFPSINVTSSMKAVSNTSVTNVTYLKVDEDGDGKVDTTYKTEANGKMEEVKDHTALYIILAAAATVILLLLILLIVLLCMAGKKKSANGRQAGAAQTEGMVCGVFGIFTGQMYPLRPGDRCTVGRKATCSIQLLHSEVSRVHCIIEMTQDGVYRVTDCSSNGTFYNNERLKKGQPYRLPKGALLAIGDADNILELR